MEDISMGLIVTILTLVILGDKTMADKLRLTPMMINKNTSSVDYN